MVILIAAAIFAPSAFAGSASAPEVTDVSGDAANAALDVTSAWIGNTGSQLLFTVEVDSLANANPVSGSAAGYRYAVSYTIDGATKYTSAATVWLVETSSNNVNGLQQHGFTETGVGTTGRTTMQPASNNLQTYAVFDAATNTVTIKVERSGAMPAGAVISDFRVTTAQSISPVSGNVHPATSTWTTADTTDKGSTYVIQ